MRAAQPSPLRASACKAKLRAANRAVPTLVLHRHQHKLSVQLKSAEVTTASVEPVAHASPAVDLPASTSASSSHDQVQQQPPQQQQVVLLPRFVKQLKLKSAACYLPHPDKEHYGGEDAHFLSEVAGGAIGVADGVGGWHESGINPAAYSRTLMRVACASMEGAPDPAASLDDWEADQGANASVMGSLSSYDSDSLSSMDGAVPSACPRQALDTAHKLTRVPGSATACLVTLDQEKKAIVAANLGDSGFLVLRDGRVVVRSTPLQHFFDCPLQLGAFPEHVDATDSADQAEMYDIPVQLGDVVIAGSDGLWDNAYEHEIVGLAPRGAGEAAAAAQRIAQLARSHASDSSFESPYIIEAKKQGYDLPWWEKVKGLKVRDGKVQLGELAGGKMDDITVLVAVVGEETVELPPVMVPAEQQELGQAASVAPAGGDGHVVAQG